MESLKARKLAAELWILETYDALRSGWYDYGAGQRAAELSRRRRELVDVELDEPTPLELVEAFERVGRPRLRRLELETFRHGTKSTTRSLEKWRRLETRLQGELERAKVAS